MSTLYSGIGELVTNDPGVGDGSPLGIVSDGALVVEGDNIAWVGERGQAPDADSRID
ncbi:MAG: imidazolonepropionase, partial [Mycobacterium sp.]|nr:imidazolonepropionase [Mycobacterium sp.]